MILGPAQPIRHDKTSAPFSNPARPLKDGRCADCRVRDTRTTSARYCLATCPHEHEFAPTPNKFSVLAELQHSPTEPKWDFDFIPTSAGSTRRRGKRGAKRHRSKGASKTTEHCENTSISALCKRIAALRLDDDDPARPGVQDNVTHSRSAAATKTTSFDLDRPSWAPRFLPNSTATETNSARTPTTTKESKPLSQSPSSHIKSLRSQASSNGSKIRRQNSQFFPISAFLACPDPSKRYPSKSKFLEAKPTEKSPQHSEFSIPSTPSSQAQEAAAKAAFRALTSTGLHTSPILSTNKSDTQQKELVLPPTLAQVSSTSCPLSLDSPTKSNKLPTMFEPTCAYPFHVAQPTKPKIVNDTTQASPITYGFGREPPFLDAARMIVNPRFHGRWQRPLMPAPAKLPESNMLAGSGHTRIACSSHAEVPPAKPLGRCLLPKQPGRKSRFFANGKLIAHDSLPAVQQPTIGIPLAQYCNSTTDATVATSTGFKSSSHSPFVDAYDRLDTKHAWTTYYSPEAQLGKSAASGGCLLQNVTPPSTPNDKDSFPQRSPLLEPRRGNSKRSTDDKRMSFSNIVLRLDTDLDESDPDLDTADYDIVRLISECDMVGPVAEHDMISPVTTEFTTGSWEEISSPPQSTFDLESADDSDADDEDDELYYESYFQSR